MPSLIYHGHSNFELLGGDARLLIDPFFTGNPKADVAADQLGPVNLVLLTHGHGDHLGDGVAIARRHGATVVAPYELAMFCQTKGCTVHAMHIGGAWTSAAGRIKMVVALHGGGVDGDTTGQHTTFPCGYVVTLDGKSIYHTGDTALTQDMQLLRDRVDVMLLPIGDNYTMGIEDAARAVEFVRPGVAIPMHYNTFELINADPQAFARRVGALSKVVILEPGARYEV